MAIKEKDHRPLNWRKARGLETFLIPVRLLSLPNLKQEAAIVFTKQCNNWSPPFKKRGNAVTNVVENLNALDRPETPPTIKPRRGLLAEVALMIDFYSKKIGFARFIQRQIGKSPP